MKSNLTNAARALNRRVELLGAGEHELLHQTFGLVSTYRMGTSDDVGADSPVYDSCFTRP